MLIFKCIFCLIAGIFTIYEVVFRYYLSSKHIVIDEELSAKINMADTKFSFQEVGRLYSPAWMAPEGIFNLILIFERLFCLKNFSITKTTGAGQCKSSGRVVFWNFIVGVEYTRSALLRSFANGNRNEGNSFQDYLKGSTISTVYLYIFKTFKVALEALRVTIPPGIARNMARLMQICMNEDPGRYFYIYNSNIKITLTIQYFIILDGRILIRYCRFWRKWLCEISYFFHFLDRNKTVTADLCKPSLDTL